jgi:hypothetical protein
VPLFTMFIRAMEKIYSKCGHARFPWCFPVSIWERSSRRDSRVEIVTIQNETLPPLSLTWTVIPSRMLSPITHPSRAYTMRTLLSDLIH